MNKFSHFVIFQFMHYLFEFNFNNIELTKELIYFILTVVILKLAHICFKVKSIFFKELIWLWSTKD